MKPKLSPNGRRHFQMHFLEWNVWIPLNISLKLVSKVLINDFPALVQIMAWRQPGDKPLSGPMLVSFLTSDHGFISHWIDVIYLPILLTVHVGNVEIVYVTSKLCTTLCIIGNERTDLFGANRNSTVSNFTKQANAVAVFQMIALDFSEIYTWVSFFAHKPICGLFHWWISCRSI